MYEIMFYGGLALFVLGLIISVVLFIRHDVRRTIGELITGKKVMKSLRTKRDMEKRPDNRCRAKKSDRVEVLQIEEDITVLAGECFSQMPVTVLRKGEITDVLSGEKDMTDILPTGDDRMDIAADG